MSGSGAAPEVQLIVPVYNEGENVRLLYNQLREDRVPYDRLSFIYDFEEDSTLPVIKELRSGDPRVQAIKNTLGRGVLNALKFAFAGAAAGPVIVIMGDNSDKLSIIPSMIELWSKGAAIVSPSRYMPGGEQHGGGLLKSGLSRLAGKSLKLAGFPTADPTNNFKLYDGAWLSKQQIESSGGFELALELCYKAFRQGKQIQELPTVWRDRTMGKSNFRLWHWLPLYLKWYLLTLQLIGFRKLGLGS